MLALGDSYTIGQSVEAGMRWPNQFGDSLTNRGYQIDEIHYIATTGWRTDNLISAIKNKNLENQGYNLVSLLIGVNNQYQNAPFSKYENEFPALLDSAIRYAGGDPSRVFVVSIPDYAFTPFGQSSGNASAISQELDQYNAFAKLISAQKNVVFFNITPISRLGVQKPEYVANDGLHPSGTQYTEWVKLILEYIEGTLKSEKINSSQQLFKIQPNPVKDVLKITIFEKSTSDVMIQLVDASGKIVYNNTFNSDSINIPVAQFQNGSYWVKVLNGVRSGTERMIKVDSR